MDSLTIFLPKSCFNIYNTVGILTKTSFNLPCAGAIIFLRYPQMTIFITNVCLQNFVIKRGITKYPHPPFTPDTFSLLATSLSIQNT